MTKTKHYVFKKNSSSSEKKEEKKQQLKIKIKTKNQTLRPFCSENPRVPASEGRGGSQGKSISCERRATIIIHLFVCLFVCLLRLFLAVQNSSIGDLVTHSLTNSVTVLLLFRCASISKIHIVTE